MVKEKNEKNGKSEENNGKSEETNEITEENNEEAKDKNGIEIIVIRKSYAIKKSKRQFRSKKDRVSAMVEVMIMKKLNLTYCEYIIQLIRAWQEDGYFFVQLELAERGTLKELLSFIAIKNLSFEEITVWHIIHDISAGLKHIHDCGVVHLGEYVLLFEFSDY